MAEPWIPEGVTHRFSYGGAHGVEVLVSAPSAEDIARGHDRRNASCVSSSVVAVNENAGSVFASIESNAFASSELGTGDTRYKTPEGAEVRIPPLREFPVHFQSFAETVCTGNSCRSQMAEAFLRSIGGDRFEVSSAGTDPVPVNPNAIRVMAERGIDISHQRSKGVKEFLGQGFPYLITVCDSANERCPIFPGVINRLHRSFEDPAGAEGSDESRLLIFRRVRDEIESAVRRSVEEADEGRPFSGAVPRMKVPAAV